MDSLIDTMLCVTHEMGFAREVADRIVFMNEGKIVEAAMLSTLLSVGAKLGSDAGIGPRV